jgi:hypothetical protein
MLQNLHIHSLKIFLIFNEHFTFFFRDSNSLSSVSFRSKRERNRAVVFFLSNVYSTQSTIETFYL